MTEFIGVDFGAKYTGTTAICFESNSGIEFIQSEDKADADAFLISVIEELKPSRVFIDAPLSLPGAYFGAGDDFMYRQCDRKCGAMSPMFLGGLTARAISLRNRYSSTDVIFYEVYPAGISRESGLEIGNYKKRSKEALESLIAIICEISPVPLKSIPQNRHQADSWLAWFIGWRYQNGLARSYGNINEGLIWI